MGETDGVVEISGEATWLGQIRAPVDLIGDANESVVRAVPSSDPSSRRVVGVCFDQMRFFNVDLHGSSFHETSFGGSNGQRRPATSTP